jgi:hypothetical protein
MNCLGFGSYFHRGNETEKITNAFPQKDDYRQIEVEEEEDDEEEGCFVSFCSFFFFFLFFFFFRLSISLASTSVKARARRTLQHEKVSKSKIDKGGQSKTVKT